MSIFQRSYDVIHQILAEGGPTEDTINRVFDFLLHGRCLMLSNTIVQREGVRVLGGPFAGMMLFNPINGMYAPLLLGCYEEELHPVIRKLPDFGYERVVNIGCGDGYYAVGLKRLMPTVEMWAHDINPDCQRKSREMAALNNVDIHVGGIFDPDNLADHARYRTLLWCDIEGAEETLLDPVRAPALADVDILVELHPVDGHHTVNTVPARFAATHAVEIIHPSGHVPTMPEWLRDSGQIHQLLAQFEWRGVATPWAMMRSHALRLG